MRAYFERVAALVRGGLQHEKKHPAMDRSSEELEFLPASIEVLESPPSPFAHKLMLSICLLFIVAISWSWLSQVDTQAEASGQLEPVGRVKPVQSLVTGRIEEILVKEGEHVEAGQLLAILDPTETEVDQEQTRSSLTYSQLNLLRTRMVIRQVLADSGEDDYQDLKDLRAWCLEQDCQFEQTPDDAEWQLQNHLFREDISSYRSSQTTKNRQIERQESTIAAINADIQRLEQLKPLYIESEKSLAASRSSGGASRLEWLTAKEKLIETTQQLQIQQNKLMEAKAALLSLQSEQHQLRQDYLLQRREKQAEHFEKTRELQRTLVKANERQENCYLKSPVAGIVQQLQLSTIGEVVEPARVLMQIVPDNDPLRVLAFLENKDIGFVFPGQQVDIKIETFPYTFYGSLKGTVTDVGKKALENESQQKLYPVYIALGKQSVFIDGEQQKLQVGMAVTADIRTGQRRLLEYFMAPLLRYKNETLNER